MTKAAVSEPPVVAPAPLSKRDRLIDGARRTFYLHGVESSTLADVSQASGVPLGNIYYYFKTKDELVEATAISLRSDLDEILARCDRRRTPVTRLKALLDELASYADAVADHGCPYGSLAAELNKHAGSAASPESQRLMLPLIEWVQAQYRAIGRRDAHELAIGLIAQCEGVSLLTHTLRDPEMLRRQFRRMQRGLDELGESTPARA